MDLLDRAVPPRRVDDRVRADPLDHLADQGDVWRLLAHGGVDLVLHGHQHDPLTMVATSPDASLRVLAAGCLIEGELGMNWPNGFHLIEVDVPRRTYAVHLRKWSKSGHFWATGTDLYRAAPDGVLRWGPAAAG